MLQMSLGMLFYKQKAVRQQCFSFGLMVMKISMCNVQMLETQHVQCSYIDGKQQIKMSEDHRISSYSERLRMQETGEPLKDGETRLCGNFKIKIRIMPVRDERKGVLEDILYSS